ncbi:hypothetical protein FBD94_14660 [Pedobacter hiemivivus]|uniref:Uncharacterized protein n=1 Tax=Pedobacter hiemivivus TaxID=2530454 RepID=A0A4U1GBQ2_9SPHI|nr:hypothetical protein [Pedobacter hiemivivus]TKC60153.1 hypothetical protein FBD94_14660 [Pedobacter hiemivivus]
MENFNVSEKYRKYLIELQFRGLNVYTVWGTDMADKETDKLLVSNTKVMAFKEIKQIELAFKDIDAPFLDDMNFREWVEHEDLSTAYSVNNLTWLSKFKFSFLNDRSTSLEVLADINLIQDFAIQVDHSRLQPIFDQPAMVNLKDFIYDNHFWKGGAKDSFALKKEEMEIVTLCNNLYTIFYDSISFV